MMNLHHTQDHVLCPLTGQIIKVQRLSYIPPKDDGVTVRSTARSNHKKGSGWSRDKPNGDNTLAHLKAALRKQAQLDLQRVDEGK